MGCDIHIALEFLLAGDFWAPIAIGLDAPRDYELFGYMAGIRNSFVEPIAPPRGLPRNLSSASEKYFDDSTGFAGDHTASWLTFSELKKLPKKFHRYLFYQITSLVAKKYGSKKVRIIFNFDS